MLKMKQRKEAAVEAAPVVGRGDEGAVAVAVLCALVVVVLSRLVSSALALPCPLLVVHSSRQSNINITPELLFFTGKGRVVQARQGQEQERKAQGRRNGCRRRSSRRHCRHGFEEGREAKQQEG